MIEFVVGWKKFLNEFWPNGTRNQSQVTDPGQPNSTGNLDHNDGHSLQSDEALKEASYCWGNCLQPRKDCTGWDT